MELLLALKAIAVVTNACVCVTDVVMVVFNWLQRGQKHNSKGKRVVTRIPRSAINIGMLLFALQVGVLMFEEDEALSLVPAVFPFQFPRSTTPRFPLGWRYAGFLIFCVGVVVRLYSIYLLGEAFTFNLQVSKDQPLVQHGTYRYLRHPSYTGLLVMFIGLCLLGSNDVLILFVIGFVIALVGHRIPSEEAMLLEHFGEKYKRFCHHRKRVVPFIY